MDLTNQMEIQHPAQISILKKLMVLSKARFSELNVTNLDNYHFSFHLKRLLELKLISKEKNTYLLTNLGKEYVSRLDLEEGKFIDQAKLAVMLFPLRTYNGKKQILVCRKTKEIGKDKLSFYSKKVRIHDTLIDTVKRGLRLINLDGLETYKGWIQLFYSIDKKPVETALFHCFSVEMDKNASEPKKITGFDPFWINIEQLSSMSEKFSRGFGSIAEKLSKINTINEVIKFDESSQS